MKHILAIITFWFVAVSLGYGVSSEILVTPNDLDQNWFVFSISSKSHPKSVTFHITMTSKVVEANYIPAASAKSILGIVTYSKDGKVNTVKAEFSPYTTAFVGKVIHTIQNGDDTGEIGGGITPPVQITLKKTKFVWTADFTISRELLKNPEVCFIFSEQAYAIIKGKPEPMPSGPIYEIRLKDFVRG